MGKRGLGGTSELLLEPTGSVTSQQTLSPPLLLLVPGHPHLTEKALARVRSNGAVASGSAWVAVRARAHSQQAMSC